MNNDKRRNVVLLRRSNSLNERVEKERKEPVILTNLRLMSAYFYLLHFNRMAKTREETEEAKDGKSGK